MTTCQCTGFRNQMLPPMQQPQIPRFRMPMPQPPMQRMPSMPLPQPPMQQNPNVSPAFQYAAQNYQRLGGSQRLMDRPMEMMSVAERQRINDMAQGMADRQRPTPFPGKGGQRSNAVPRQGWAAPNAVSPGKGVRSYASASKSHARRSGTGLRDLVRLHPGLWVNCSPFGFSRQIFLSMPRL
jgi:hypothetical protein